PIGNLMNVSKVVLDIDAGAAGSPDAPHEIDNLAHLRDAECGGRLIEDDQVCVVVHCPTDRDALPLAAGEVGTGRVDGDAEPAKANDFLQNLIRDLLFALNVDEAKEVGNLPASEKIPPERLFLGDRLVLVDSLGR